MNRITEEFDEIRPYHDDEVKDVIDRLLADDDFLAFLGSYHSPVLGRYFPRVVRFGARRLVKRLLGNVTSIADFQDVLSNYAKRIEVETTSGFQYEGIDQLSPDEAYLFVGNHRDIAGDSLWVNYALWLSSFDTVRIAVGDNLVQRDFATALMKLNKSFFIRRSEEGTKKIYAALLESSRYIHHSIADGHSIWIAQSEGRAKDGIDLTDPALIKMFVLAKRKQPLNETIDTLNIVPVSISYEYDPCDNLKAKELFAIANEGGYEKPPGEDLLSLVKGLGDQKGRVTLRFGQRLQGDFRSAPEVANAIDRQVLDNLQLYQINYWALRRLAKTRSQEKYVSTWNALQESCDKVDTTEFESRLANCPEMLRTQWLEMYANPVVNKFVSKSTRLAPI